MEEQYPRYRIEQTSEHGFVITERAESTEPDDGYSYKTLTTPDGNPVAHHSRELLTRVVAELVLSPPPELIRRLSNFRLLCLQIDGAPRYRSTPQWVVFGNTLGVGDWYVYDTEITDDQLENEGREFEGHGHWEYRLPIDSVKDSDILTLDSDDLIYKSKDTHIGAALSMQGNSKFKSLHPLASDPLFRVYYDDDVPNKTNFLAQVSSLRNFVMGMVGTDNLRDIVDSCMWSNPVCRHSDHASEYNWYQCKHPGKSYQNYNIKLMEKIAQSSPEKLEVMDEILNRTRSISLAVAFGSEFLLPQEFAICSLAFNYIFWSNEIDEPSNQYSWDEKLTEEGSSIEWNSVPEMNDLVGVASLLSGYIEASKTVTENLIEIGEGNTVEFKSTFRWDVNQEKIVKRKNIESECLKTIVAFLNTEGGNLVIGVRDDATIFGTELDGFKNNDTYRTHIANQINQRMSPNYGEYLKYHFEIIESKRILRIECIKLPGNLIAALDGSVFRRNSSQTVELSAEEAIAWASQRQND